jgi:hypothetical protein
MRLDNPSQYKFVKFQVSTSKGKKYDAILINKITKKEKKVSFGAIGYQQFRDKALGRYKKDDHNDETRRRLYRQRHAGEDNYKFSSGYFAMKYLW